MRPPKPPPALFPQQTLLVSLTTLLLLLRPRPAHSCTTIAVGRAATTDGSVLCSHSNDGEGTTDPRLVLIPASSWPENSTRPVFYSPESFPRYVGSARSSSDDGDVVEAYAPGRGYNPPREFEPICRIPQVGNTYRYMEETYAAMNERQLGIAESTCSGVFGAAPRGMSYPGYGVGKACFSVDALTQIAMERHYKARDAILEMGSLAVRYGFYGAGLFEGTAESLIVTDTEEAWVFHILPDPTGESAIWAARRVPDNSFAVVPNVFIIREIFEDDGANFLYSDSVFTVAEDLGWWSEADGQKLDFAATYSDGEYSHKYYSGRRSWGIFRLLSPSLNLSATYEEWRISDPYPFAAEPDAKISVDDLAGAMRTFYEGTPYSQAGGGGSDDDDDKPSLGLNLAGGPWKSPDHVAGGNSTPGVVGSWERTVGLYRTSDSFIVQSRSHLPDDVGGVLWYGAYAAPYAAYTPFSAGMTSLPRATLGHHMKLDKDTLFWANRYVGNYVRLKWTDMMEEVRKFQSDVMGENLELQGRIDAAAPASSLCHLYGANAVRTVARTWDLADHLMFKYADGQVHSTPDGSPLGTETSPRKYDRNGATTHEADAIDQPGYPNDWLEAVGYEDGPPPPPDCKDLGWRCGHRPKEEEGGDRPRLHGEAVEGEEDEDGKRRENDEEEERPGGRTTTTRTKMRKGRNADAWAEYEQRRAEAREAGTRGCGTRGDVAAAIGGGGGNDACREATGAGRGGGGGGGKLDVDAAGIAAATVE